MSRHSIVIALALFWVALGSWSAFAAQSTADVSITEESKKSMRSALLGERDAILDSAEPYVIGHGDILSVSVYGEGDMAATAATVAGLDDGSSGADSGAKQGIEVMIDGRVSLKHLGDVEVVGMTLTELADYLRSLYESVFSEPMVTTTLVQSNSLRYTVMGNVSQSGIFHFDYPHTLVQVIARAGGFSEWANRKLTLIREDIQEKDVSFFDGNTMTFDYDRFIAGKDIGKNIVVRAGDIIVAH